jgi:hypothetical protein
MGGKLPPFCEVFALRAGSFKIFTVYFYFLWVSSRHLLKKSRFGNVISNGEKNKSETIKKRDCRMGCFALLRPPFPKNSNLFFGIQIMLIDLSLRLIAAMQQGSRRLLFSALTALRHPPKLL